MKQTFKIFLFAIIALFTINAANAQNQRDHRKSRQDFVEIKANYIAKELNFDEATTEQFVKTYCECEKEIWDAKPDIKPDGTYSTDAEAEAAIMARFEHSQKILDIRRKYYEEYKKFLTPIQIEKVYSFEGKTMKKLHKNHRSHKARKHRKARKTREVRNVSEAKVSE